MPVRTLNEAKVQIWEDDGEGAVVGVVPLFNECYAQQVNITGSLETLRRLCTGRTRPKIHTRQHEFAARLIEFYYNQDVQLNFADMYERQVRLQYWLIIREGEEDQEIHKIKTAVIRDFELGAGDNEPFFLTLDLTAEDYSNDAGS